jgi:hypothetical protein
MAQVSNPVTNKLLKSAQSGMGWDPWFSVPVTSPHTALGNGARSAGYGYHRPEIIIPPLSLSKVLMENNNVSTGPDSCKCDTSTCVPAGYIKVLEKKCSLSSYQKIVPFIKRYYDMAKSKHFYPINSNDGQSCSIWLWHLCKHMRCDCRYAVRILYGFIPLLTTSDS